VAQQFIGKLASGGGRSDGARRKGGRKMVVGMEWPVAIILYNV